MVDVVAPTYRYITTDLLTNRILAEVQFRGVNYSLGLGSAGSFSGNVYVNSESSKLNLYTATLPGKTGLYILRDDECVWGGITWSRSYDPTSRVLSINASEFQTYFSHRIMWKTLNTTYGGTLVVSDKTSDAYITMEAGVPFDVVEGEPVKVIFTGDYVNLTGFFETLPNSDQRVIYINPKDNWVRAKNKKVTTINSDMTKATIQIATAGSHGLVAGDKVTVSNTGIKRLNGTRVVKSVVSSNVFTLELGTSDTTAGLNKKDGSWVALNANAKVTKNGSIPDGSYTVSVDTKPTTYALVRGVIEAAMRDFTGYGFANSAIEAGISLAYDVTSYQCDGGVVTLTTNTPHTMSVGQIVELKNIDSRINGFQEVSEIVDDTTVRLQTSSSSITYTTTTAEVAYISARKTQNLITTYAFTANHGFQEGDTISIRNVPRVSRQVTQDGKTKTIYDKHNIENTTVLSVPSATTITVKTKITYNDATSVDYTKYQKNPNAYVISTPQVISNSYGPFPQNSDIGITFEETDAELFGVETGNVLVRGSELKKVADVIEQYATAGNGGTGFDYRFDCHYDPDVNQFVRVFRMFPHKTGDDVAYSTNALTALGADKVVFEFPGNIKEFSMSESAEDVATRMFVLGDKPELSGTASQPYSAAADIELLDMNWPLYDSSENSQAQNSGDEEVLHDIATKLVSEHRPPIVDFSLTINGSLIPYVGSYKPGDWCSIIINDEFVKMRLASDLEPRDDLLIRKILSVKVAVPDSFTVPEQVTLDLVAAADVNKYVAPQQKTTI